MSDRVRPATDGDAEGIASLFARCLPDPWSASMIAEGFRHGCRGLVIGEGARPDAVVLVQLIVPEAEILQLAVAPEQRRRGLGKRLVREGLAVAAHAGAAMAYLEVRPSNEAALALYRGEGFRETGRRRAYYRDGEDALVLERALAVPLPRPSSPNVR